MPRNYFLCPDESCEWSINWAYIPPKPDPDMGLLIAAHIEACHPEMLYGDIIPAYVYKKFKRLVVPLAR